MKWIEPTMEYNRQLQAYRQALLAWEEPLNGCGSLRRFNTTRHRLDQATG